MKKFFMCIAAIGMLAGCCSKTAQEAAETTMREVSGTVNEATSMHVYAVTLSDGTVRSFVRTDSTVIESENGVVIGNPITVAYHVEKHEDASDSIYVADKILVKDTPLIGTWLKPIEGMNDQYDGVELHSDRSAASVNMSTLQYESYDAVSGATLVLAGKSLGNGQTIAFSDTFYVAKCDGDSLVIEGKDKVMTRYARQK